LKHIFSKEIKIQNHACNIFRKKNLKYIISSGKTIFREKFGTVIRNELLRMLNLFFWKIFFEKEIQNIASLIVKLFYLERFFDKEIRNIRFRI
jgi:hypothetical protein